MTYDEAIDFLFSLQKFGIKMELKNIEELLSFLDNPHRRFKSIHIAGTNGKGSVSVIIDTILRTAGYKTGLYTSPHLYRFEERIRVSGQIIQPTQVVDFIEHMMPLIKDTKSTFFEATTAMAFNHFAEAGIDFGVIETGLGGRLDATNVISPELAIITNITPDHTEHLGDTVQKIAAEKAGIIKDGIDVVTGVMNASALSTIQQYAGTRGAHFHYVPHESECTLEDLSTEGTRFSYTSPDSYLPHLFIPLIGSHQVQNTEIAIRAIEIIRKNGVAISDEHIREGLKHVHWPGRLQIVDKDPLTVMDVAHNPAGTAVLSRALREIFRVNKMILIFGVMGDKDYKTMLSILAPLTRLTVATKPRMERALETSFISEEIRKYNQECIEEESTVEAFKLARKLSSSGELVCITGSHFTVGEILEYLERKGS